MFHRFALCLPYRILITSQSREWRKLGGTLIKAHLWMVL